MSQFFVARGQQSSLMSGKETSYGVKATTFDQTHIYETLGLKITDAPVNLDGARGQNDTPYPVNGGRTISGAVTLESTEDTIAWWLAMGMGTQSAPSTQIVNTTLNGATTIGATTFVLTSGLNVFPGMKLSIDTSTNLETLTVATVQGTSITTTTAATKAHSNSVAVTCTATGAYLSKFTLGNDLTSFTLQSNLFNTSGGSFAASNFLGCMIESLAFKFAKGQVKVDPSVDAQDFSSESSPATATYSTKSPFVFEQQLSPPQWNATIIGTGLEASVISLTATLNNALQKGIYSLGNGFRQRKPQLGKRAVSGSMSLDYGSTTVRDAFNAAQSGGQKPAVALTLPIYGTDIIDTANGVPYAMTVVLPKVFLSAWDGGWKGSGSLNQAVTFSAHPSGAGTNDSITVYYIGSNSTAY